MDAYGEVVYADGCNAGQGGKVSISEAIIDELLDMRWWDWSQAVIELETSLLLDEDVNEDVIARMRAVVKEVAG